MKKKKAGQPQDSACLSCGSKMLVLHGPEASSREMLSALKHISFYSRINHARFKDYGGIADAVLKKMGVPTGTLILLASLCGCAMFRESPPSVQPFPLNPAYTEIRADPGRVLDERTKIGYTRAGEGFAGSPTLCGFVDFKTKTVWIARAMDCPLAQTRRHENCHIEARENMTVDQCHDGRKF